MFPLRKTNKTFIESLHPITLILYFVILGLVAMTYTHPIYLGSLFLIVAINMISIGALKKWKGYLAFSLLMTFFIVVINILVSRNGNTILLEGIRIPVFGELIITKEAIFYGLNMGLKIALIVSIFCLYDSMMNPDKALSFFSRFIPKSALLVILTSLMIPQMKRSLENITIAMEMRGADFRNRNLLKNIKSRYPLLKILLLSSLEGSWDTAEALYARGFSSTKRSYYSKEEWRIKDSIIVTAIGFSFLGFTATLFYKKGFFEFYPTLQKFLQYNDLTFIVWIFSGFAILPILNFLLEKWNYLRLKI